MLQTLQPIVYRLKEDGTPQEPTQSIPASTIQSIEDIQAIAKVHCNIIIPVSDGPQEKNSTLITYSVITRESSNQGCDLNQQTFLYIWVVAADGTVTLRVQDVVEFWEKAQPEHYTKALTEGMFV